jgi:hypothetical protein
MFLLGGRLERENETVRAMVEIYCKSNHNNEMNNCPKCKQVYEYASYRILRCPHKEEKPSCAKCEIHCFNKQMKEEIKKVMRFSGPRMLIYHPILSIFHYLDSLKSGSLKKRVI